MSEQPPPRFCPNCGAQNPLSLPRCATCGQPLGRRDDHARLWGTHDEPLPDDDGNIIDLYPTIDPSPRATTPSDPTVPIEVTTRRPGEGSERPVDPWSSAGGRLSKVATPAGPTPTLAASAPPAASAPAAAPARKGPPGCVLGCLGLLVILAVALFFVWSAARPSITRWTGDQIGEGISTELDGVDALRVRGSGDVVITADQINAELARNAGAFDPLTDVRVEITPDGFRATGKLFRSESSLTGSLDLAGGRIVVVDPAISGPAGRLVDAEQLATRFERELASLFRRLDLQPTAVQLRDGSIVVTTVPTT